MDNVELQTTKDNSFYERCRVCAAPNWLGVSLYGDDPQRPKDLIKKIKDHIGIEVFVEDDLPRRLCYQCLFYIENFDKYKRGCLKAQFTLEHWEYYVRRIPIPDNYKPPKRRPPNNTNDSENSSDQSSNDSSIGSVAEKLSIPIVHPISAQKTGETTIVGDKKSFNCSSCSSNSSLPRCTVKEDCTTTNNLKERDPCVSHDNIKLAKQIRLVLQEYEKNKLHSGNSNIVTPEVNNIETNADMIEAKTIKMFHEDTNNQNYIIQQTKPTTMPHLLGPQVQEMDEDNDNDDELYLSPFMAKVVMNNKNAEERNYLKSKSYYGVDDDHDSTDEDFVEESSIQTENIDQCREKESSSKSEIIDYVDNDVISDTSQNDMSSRRDENINNVEFSESNDVQPEKFKIAQNSDLCKDIVKDKNTSDKPDIYSSLNSADSHSKSKPALSSINVSVSCPSYIHDVTEGNNQKQYKRIDILESSEVLIMIPSQFCESATDPQCITTSVKQDQLAAETTTSIVKLNTVTPAVESNIFHEKEQEKMHISCDQTHTHDKIAEETIPEFGCEIPTKQSKEIPSNDISLYDTPTGILGMIAGETASTKHVSCVGHQNSLTNLDIITICDSDANEPDKSNTSDKCGESPSKLSNERNTRSSEEITSLKTRKRSIDLDSCETSIKQLKTVEILASAKTVTLSEECYDLQIAESASLDSEHSECISGTIEEENCASDNQFAGHYDVDQLNEELETSANAFQEQNKKATQDGKVNNSDSSSKENTCFIASPRVRKALKPLKRDLEEQKARKGIRKVIPPEKTTARSKSCDSNKLHKRVGFTNDDVDLDKPSQRRGFQISPQNKLTKEVNRAPSKLDKGSATKLCSKFNEATLSRASRICQLVHSDSGSPRKLSADSNDVVTSPVRTPVHTKENTANENNPSYSSRNGLQESTSTPQKRRVMEESTCTYVNDPKLSDEIVIVCESISSETASKTVMERKQEILHQRTSQEGDGNQFCCKLCTASFEQKLNLIHHVMLIHARPNTSPSKTSTEEDFNFSCEECQTKFQSALNLMNHMRRIHGKVWKVLKVKRKKSKKSE